MTRDVRRHGGRSEDKHRLESGPGPGKRSLVEGLGDAPTGEPGKQTLTQVMQFKVSDAATIPGGGPDARAGGSGAGARMPADVQAKMEQSFGADFSAVRVHDGQSAVPGAQAYAKGTDIHFAPGRYDPHSEAGQSLLGHELSHVVQQSQGRVQATTQHKGIELNDDAALEREADVQGAAAARGERVSGGAPGAIGSRGAAMVQCFVPADDTERGAVTTALDTLLGNGNDPGGIRAAITTHATNLVALQAAVQTVATTAAVPLNDRAPLIALLGNDLELTAALLTAAIATSGAGTPAVRLNRVLAANPLTPRTLNDLRPLIADQHAIDEKILRGRTGTPLGANEKPTAEHRTLIGGHSPELVNDTANVVETDVTNPNATHYIGFRRLIRSDGGASAIAVRDMTHDDPVAQCTTAGGIAGTAAAAAVAPVNPVPPSLAVSNPAGFAKATAAFHAKLARFNDAQAAAAAALVQLRLHAGTVRGVAGAAAASPTSGGAVKPFIDSMSDLLASMNALVIATTVVDPGAGAVAQAALTAIRDRFESRGPVLSVKKNSTLAPAGMTDDDVLRAGDQTAATPATLIRDDATDNAPADGAQIDTKHQLLINNVVWVVMKSNVTFRTGHPPTLTGGTVISSYPTSLTAVPADPVHPAKDTDRFSTIP